MEKVIPDRLKPYRSLWEGVGQKENSERAKDTLATFFSSPPTQSA